MAIEVFVGAISIGSLTYWLVYFLISNRCKHRWKIIHEGNTVSGACRVVGRWYDQECIHCGKIRRTTTRY